MNNLKLLPFLICLISCQNQLDVLPTTTSNAKRLYTVSDVTEPYADRMFNTCLNEYVYLAGVAHYYLKESFDNGYYIDYEITVNASGQSDSGIQFKGGGKYSGRVRENEGDIKGKVFYNITYHSLGGNKMGYYQHANFILKNDSIRVEFNYEIPTCE